MTRRNLFLSLLALAALAGGQFSTTSLARTRKNGREVKFTVRVENVSAKDGQTAKDGTKWPFALSPGFYAVHENEVRFFNPGKAASPNGLEMQAEDGNPSGMVNFLMGHHSGMLHGVFNTPNGAETPGPVGPGGAYEFTFTAREGMRLSLVTMFGQSNDWFYAAEPGGIKLFENGRPVSGDITSKFVLWDAGTEVNEEPGVGAHQAPRQAGANTGAAENGKVHKAKDSAFFSKTGELFRVTITPQQ